ncbi:ornithine cyclodeaminase family protein [Candidatus Aerophobetes bacterium]|nr:ornithine cyclodeaminase family protein [Candidatus Aerophobetes bacterium]
MISFRVLNEEIIKELLDIKNVIQIVEEAYILKDSDQASLFPIITHVFEPGKADMDIKSGQLKGNVNVFGLKIVSWFGENIKKNLPSLIGAIMVFDSQTGVPLGVLSAEHITGLRTGAAGGIGAKYLARKDSENLLIIGAGRQALFQTAAALTTLENIKKVTVYDPISNEMAINFCNNIKIRLKNDFLSKYENDKDYFKTLAKRYDIIFKVADDIKKAVGEADVIVTATPSRKPIIKKEWVKRGTHITCIGSDMEGKQEINENIFSIARVFADDINQIIKVGEAEIPIKKGIITREDIVAEIGEVISGKVAGRVSEGDITIFDSTGIALQDLVTASLALKVAKEKDLGIIVEL